MSKLQSTSNYLIGAGLVTSVTSVAGIIYYNWKKSKCLNKLDVNSLDNNILIDKYNDRITYSAITLGTVFSVSSLAYLLVKSRKI